jgi:GR25 family glycosyltransferase involved in LPS biosynthesis
MKIYSPIINKNSNQKKYKPDCLNYYFDQIFVISFKDDKENRKKIKEYFDKFNIDFVFFDAIEGKKDTAIVNHYNDYLTWKFSDKRTNPLEKSYKRKLIKSPGALGLLYTYEKILEICIHKKYKNVIIFEDDVLLDNNFVNKTISVIKQKPDYDMIYLGASHHIWKDSKIEQLENIQIYKAPFVLDGSFATIYSHKIFERFLSLIKKHNCPVDVCLRYINKKNNSYVIYPNIAIAETTKVSTISNETRNLRFHKNTLRWDLSNINFSRSPLKVSVIVANFNNEVYIPYCLNSLKKQTYSNIEIVLVDDCSTDSSVKVAEKWKKQNKDVDLKIITLDKNVGAYKCRNIGLQNCNGFFVTLLDSDDVLLSSKIYNDVYNYFNYEDFTIFLSQMYRSQNINIQSFSDEKLLISEIEKEREQAIKEYGSYPWDYKFRLGMPTIFVEKSFFNKYGCWRDDFRFGMDIELIQRYILQRYYKYIDHKSLFVNTQLRKTQKYGIFYDDKMNCVSFPMNQKNATNICKDSDRQSIHDNVNKQLQNILLSIETA